MYNKSVGKDCAGGEERTCTFVSHEYEWRVGQVAYPKEGTLVETRLGLQPYNSHERTTKPLSSPISSYQKRIIFPFAPEKASLGQSKYIYAMPATIQYS